MGAVARAAPDAIAVIAGKRAITYEELDMRQRRVAGALRAGGITRGERIAVVARNGLPLLEVLMGSLRAGIVPVPINPSASSGEIAYLVEHVDARWVFTDEMREHGNLVNRTITFGDAYERLLHESEPADVEDVTLTRPLHFTSGSTGRPKGVWVPPMAADVAARSAEAFVHEWALTPDDVHLVCGPLVHSAPARFALRSLEAGGKVVLQPKFDAAETLAATELFGVTTTFLVPSHLQRMRGLGERGTRRHDLSALRLVAHAGEPIDQDLKRWAIGLFGAETLWEFYGATEGQATRISGEEWLRKPGSVGRPRTGARVFVADPNRRILPAGEQGLVWIEDASAPRFEYWQDPERTRRCRWGAAFTANDLGWLDQDGYLFLAGRADEVIITGGVNVSPAEIERVLSTHPAVAEVMVYGHPNEEWGREVRALVVPVYALPLDPDHLRDWARARLGAIKSPKVIELVDELPRGSTGKLADTEHP